ncbi:tRNA (adenosine(37)-N6)-threonylcarbamoyltransferase complex dimerization subunit type 1 TsaB [Ascidiaceihabitans sp.]|uniref:tRNA (adenosine(37)-N6)-threonylcarbamoyltransferase complex dimerization subunit type 1 TsaB n=1 Tax=Ascidiaceihabitans sp. TaxID=1872644 RepID=UPI003297835E
MTGPVILGFDTSGAHCAAALICGSEMLEMVQEPMAKGQAERLIPFLQDMLSRHSLGFPDLAALGVGVGPGNFTGIRIGVSAARGLALGLGLPAYGVNGFEQRQMLFPDGTLIAVPAPRDAVYVQAEDGPALALRKDIEAVGKSLPDDPSPDALAGAIARLAALRYPSPTAAPAPFYVRAPDAAPPKDAPPVILP